MQVFEKVFSTVKPEKVTFDEKHVYVNEDISEVPEDEREAEKEMLPGGAELPTLYQYKVTQYDKDEYIESTSQKQKALDQRATDIEDMILEISEVVYA